MQDGVTYANGCLAVCQGVTVAHQGRCGQPQQMQHITSQGRCRPLTMLVYMQAPSLHVAVPKKANVPTDISTSHMTAATPVILVHSLRSCWVAPGDTIRTPLILHLPPCLHGVHLPCSIIHGCEQPAQQQQQQQRCWHCRPTACHYNARHAAVRPAGLLAAGAIRLRVL
jgi:hypothetical protein